MAIEVIKNTREAQGPPEAPRRGDGSLYPLCMFFDGYKYVAFADGPDELLNELIPGYADMQTEDERLTARILHAIKTQVVQQAYILADAAPEDLEALSDAERAAIRGPRTSQPHGWGGDPDGLGDTWSSRIPLVLVDTGYAPYTDIRPPISAFGDVRHPENMIWLRPGDPWEYLETLAEVGAIGLSEANI